jgi:tripartite motif-containing protein 71
MFLVVSYNQPKLGAFASWSANGITLTNSNTIGWYPYGIYVNTNNTIYVSNREKGKIQMCLEGNMTFTSNTFNNISNSHSLFVTITGDIYVDNGYPNGRVDKWPSNTTMGDPVMTVSQECYGLFVSINNILYCSIMDLHHIVTKSLDSGLNASTTVAGTSCPGSTSYMLYYPCGIFVDVNLNLYVADCGNDRVQLFKTGQFSGITVAGNGTSGTFMLNCPTGIVLDGTHYLFIVDSGNHRIIGSGPNGFRCLVGCFGSGPLSNVLNYPQNMAFDSHGNMLVIDTGNSRLQKFILLNDSYSKCQADYLVKLMT